MRLPEAIVNVTLVTTAEAPALRPRLLPTGFPFCASLITGPTLTGGGTA
jgi:hypothetical protein